MSRSKYIKISLKILIFINNHFLKKLGVCIWICLDIIQNFVQFCEFSSFYSYMREFSLEKPNFVCLATYNDTPLGPSYLTSTLVYFLLSHWQKKIFNTCCIQHCFLALKPKESAQRNWSWVSAKVNNSSPKGTVHEFLVDSAKSVVT